MYNLYDVYICMYVSTHKCTQIVPWYITHRSPFQRQTFQKFSLKFLVLFLPS